MQKASLLSGFGIGIGLMYLFDPTRGRRRRAVVRDKAKHLIRKSEEAVRKTSRDLSNRAHGAAASAKTRLREERFSPEVLVERVRSKIGHLVRHPSAIEVSVYNGGTVVLSGAVPEDEAKNLLSGVQAVRSVSHVENRLSVNK